LANEDAARLKHGFESRFCWRAFSRSTSAAKLVSESITLSIALSRVRSRSSKYKKTRTPASMICFSALGGLDLLAAQTGFLGHE
jgi:hypothetical protein